MRVQLIEDNFLEKFRQEREVRNRSVVFQFVWIQIVFLEERAHNSRLEGIRNSSSSERSVDDVSDEREKNRKTVGIKRSWERIQFACLERHRLYCFEKFFIGDWSESSKRCAREERVRWAGLTRCHVEFSTKSFYFGGEILREY